MGWLDRLPTWARDLILMIAAGILTWLGTDIVPMLQDKGGASALAAAALLLVINAVTPLTRAYGPRRTPQTQGDGSASSSPPAGP